MNPKGSAESTGIRPPPPARGAMAEASVVAIVARGTGRLLGETLLPAPAAAFASASWKEDSFARRL